MIRRQLIRLTAVRSRKRSPLTDRPHLIYAVPARVNGLRHFSPTIPVPWRGPESTHPKIFLTRCLVWRVRYSASSNAFQQETAALRCKLDGGASHSWCKLRVAPENPHLKQALTSRKRLMQARRQGRSTIHVPQRLTFGSRLAPHPPPKMLTVPSCEGSFCRVAVVKTHSCRHLSRFPRADPTD